MKTTQAREAVARSLVVLATWAAGTAAACGFPGVSFDNAADASAEGGPAPGTPTAFDSSLGGEGPAVEGGVDLAPDAKDGASNASSGGTGPVDSGREAAIHDANEETRDATTEDSATGSSGSSSGASVEGGTSSGATSSGGASDSGGGGASSSGLAGSSSSGSLGGSSGGGSSSSGAGGGSSSSGAGGGSSSSGTGGGSSSSGTGGGSGSGSSGSSSGSGGPAGSSSGGIVTGSSGGSGGSGIAGCDCDGGQTLYPANLGDCSAAALGNLGLVCTAAVSGFVGADPGCGNAGTFETCTPDLLTLPVSVICTAATAAAPVVQRCH